MYKIFKEKIFDSEIGEYETYGIECNNGIKIRDICTNYENLCKFVSSLNKHNVNTKHIDYFVQGFLEETNNIIN